MQEGSVTRASEKLHLAQPTISAQVSALEKLLGNKLFNWRGRVLELTETGRTVFHDADEIFTLGRELTNSLKSNTCGQEMRLTIGISDALPKLIAYRLIKPAFHLSESVQVSCHEDKAGRLMTEISQQKINLVLSEVQANSDVDGIQLFNHLLGECHVTVFASPCLAIRYRSGFPQSLREAPFLLPTRNTAVRRSLEQ